MAKQYNFKVKNKMTLNQIMAWVAFAVGLISICFLWAPGVLIKGVYYGKITPVSVWSTIWGSGFSITAGLVVAFFLTLAASLVCLGALGFRIVGAISFLLYIAAGVLYFCAIPLIGNAAEAQGSLVGLGWGTYVVGILNFIGAIFAFLATRGD